MEYKDYLLWAISGNGGGSSVTKYTVTYNGDEGGLYPPDDISLVDTGEYYPESIVLFSTGELYLNSIDGETTGTHYYGEVKTLETGLYFISMPSQNVTITASTLSPK